MLTLPSDIHSCFNIVDYHTRVSYRNVCAIMLDKKKKNNTYDTRLANLSLLTFKFRHTRVGDRRLKRLPEAFIRHIESNPSFGRWQKGLFIVVAAEVAQRHGRPPSGLVLGQPATTHPFICHARSSTVRRQEVATTIWILH